ncbi:MAG: hypothetical protein HY315_01570 [Acidobacteria bacterium]|nr:hypothetical protein [Acidobacteriota bacterium]
MRSISRVYLALVVLLPLSTASVAQSQREARSPAGTSEQVLGKLQAAAIQHEAIALSIEEQNFSEIIPELKTIFDLALPQEYEIYQVQEVQSIVQKLREKRQFSMASAVVDLGLRYLQEDKSRASLYLLKSQLYRDNGQIREAAEATEMARKYYQNSIRGSRAQ